MMLTLINSHLELKNGVSNVIIEDLGGWMGRNVADFLGDLNQTHISPKTKKSGLCTLGRPSSGYFRIL